MKKIRWKELVIALIMACCFLVGCAPFSKHNVENIKEIQTEIFLDKPEDMIYIEGGEEKQLSAAFLDTVYEGFTELMKTLQRVDTLKIPFDVSRIEAWKKENTCFEFRYKQRRNYIGALEKDEGLFSWGDLRFDAFLFVYYSGGLIAVPYVDDNYVGINDLFLFLVFPEEDINNFISLI